MSTGRPTFILKFTDGDRCSVVIETLEILIGEVRPARKMAETMAWAGENRELLLEKWKEITR